MLAGNFKIVSDAHELPPTARDALPKGSFFFGGCRAAECFAYTQPEYFDEDDAELRVFDGGRTIWRGSAPRGLRDLDELRTIIDPTNLLVSDFHILTHISELPEPVRKLLSPMADPGEPWTPTDLVRDRALPTRRLLFAGCSETRCFAHFEHGGRGWNTQLEVFAGDRKIWTGTALEKATDLNHLRAKLYAGKFEH